VTRGRLAGVPVLVLIAVALAGCGVGAGDEAQGTRLTVTDAFGARTLVQLESPEARGEETVMRILQRNARVTTRYGGSFVQSIDGRAGGREGGRPVDWFFYVNGVEAGEGAASTTVEEGDRIWWDRHDWGAAMRVPAVVGSFPEPFVNGSGGKRYPVRVECADPRTPPCRTVQRRLTDEDVPAAAGRLRSVTATTTLRVIVGPWARISGDIGVVRLEQGPEASGVYARPSADGKRCDLLDARGRTTRTLGAGSGLVAATRAGDDAPLWVVTGTDDAGVAAAARAFDEGPLADHFALAIADDVGVPLPTTPGRRPSR
jgi:hypothetical protein